MKDARRNKTLSEFPRGFGHDAEIVGLRLDRQVLEITLKDSIVETIVIPKIASIAMTDFALQNVLFSINKISNLNEIKTLMQGLALEKGGAIGEKMIKSVLDNGGTILHFDATVGLKGLIVSKAKADEIQLIEEKIGPD